MEEMTLREIKDKHFGGCFKNMAKAGGMTVQGLRNCMSMRRKAKLLANGDFIMITSKTVEFKMGGKTDADAES